MFSDWAGNAPTARIGAWSLADKKRLSVSIPGVMPIGFVDDQLIYLSGSGALMGIPFNTRRGDTIGTATQLGDSASGYANFVKAALSQSGSLVFFTGSPTRQIVRYD